MYCVCVGLLPVGGSIWNGVRICDKLQIYLGVAHWRIDWAPCDRTRNAGCGARRWLSSWLRRDQKLRSPKSLAKTFLFLASSVVMMAQHDLKKLAASQICGAEDAPKENEMFSLLSWQSPRREMWTSSRTFEQNRATDWQSIHSLLLERKSHHRCRAALNQHTQLLLTHFLAMSATFSSPTSCFDSVLLLL